MDRLAETPTTLRRLGRLARAASVAVCGGMIGCHAVGGWTWDYGRLIPVPVLSPLATRRMPDLVETPSLSPSPGLPHRPEAQSPGAVVVPVSHEAPPADAAALPDLLTRPLIPPTSEQPITLAAALEAAGASNPTIALANEAIWAARADQMQARALLLPDLAAGMTYHQHQGALQAGTGLIRVVDSQDIYAGMGAFAVGAGTVTVPGVRLSAHLADAAFAPRAAAERLLGRRFAAAATNNNVLLDVADRYLALAAAQERRQAIHQSEQEVGEVVRLTANFAKAGQGRHGDADRARADALIFHDEAERAEEEVAVAAADLAELLAVDPSARLRAAGDVLVPIRLIPDDADLAGLVHTALASRPEAGAAAAAVAESQTRLRQERVRPLLPVVALGFSVGGFGGGSNLTPPRFGPLDGRTDFDAMAVWSLRNAGAGNLAIAHERRAALGVALAEQERVLDQIAREVAEAHALIQTRRQEIDAASRRVTSAETTYRLDLARAKNIEGYPIELLHSVRLANAARAEYIRALIDFNRAQFRLFVALGQPPPALHPGDSQ